MYLEQIRYRLSRNISIIQSLTTYHRVLRNPVGGAPATLSVLLCTLLILGCNDKSSLEIVSRHADDKITLSPGHPPRVVIDCPDGIGSATVTAYESWPESIELELRLSALEGLVVQRGHAEHRFEVTASGAALLEPPNSRAIKLIQQPGVQPDGSRQTAFVVQVFPERFADSSAVITLEWVDFYR